MKLLPFVSGALAALTLFTPFSSYIRREKQAEPEKNENETEIAEAFGEYLPGIVCWGDSLTVGAGGDGVTYPDTLAGLIHEDLGREVDVVNMGVGGETSPTIVARSGTVPFRVQGFTIPADTTPVPIKIYSDLHKRVLPLIQGDGGVNPVSIGGVAGRITVKLSTVTEWSEYYFTRAEAGEEVPVEKGTEIVTYSADKWRDYINVVFIGTNGDFKNVDELIEQQKYILSRSEKNGERYIVVGLYTLNSYQVKKQCDAAYFEELEEAMKSEYGERFIDARGYFTSEGLADAGIEPTETDLAAIAEGKVPPSLMADDLLHLNAKGYELLGRLIYERMDALGYFGEVRGALEK